MTQENNIGNKKCFCIYTVKYWFFQNFYKAVFLRVLLCYYVVIVMDYNKKLSADKRNI